MRVNAYYMDERKQRIDPDEIDEMEEEQVPESKELEETAFTEKARRWIFLLIMLRDLLFPNMASF